MHAKGKALLGIAAAGTTVLAATLGVAGIGAAAASPARSLEHHVGAAILSPRTSDLWTSSNWSGYALGSKTTAKGTYKSVSASWNIPTVKANTGTKYSAQWIGIDGFANQQLIQTGTEADYQGGHAQYGVWWEVLPAAETVINEPVKPGQHMTASINETSTDVWVIKISNGSWSFTKTVTRTTSNNFPGQSAEWIVEAPEVGGSIASIAHTGRVTFTKCTVNGKSAGLTAANGGELKQGGKVKEIPSKPSTAGDAFTMGYGAKAPPAPKS
jgi:hypothetical protein